jgi:serine/threonine-protein kinase
VGARIHNRYTVRDYVGGGSFGAVYEVWDEFLKEEVALKVITPKPGIAWDLEAAAMAALRGTFVLPILDAAVVAGTPIIVTPLMRNRSLDRWLPTTGIELGRAVTWAQQACSGISRIHDRKLLHNDIKPGNLFIDDHEKVLVADLGEAAVMDANGRGRFAGSPFTLAPEVAAAFGISGALPGTVRSDVYSLGATLYWMIAGHPLNPALASIHDPAASTAIISLHQPRALWDVAPHVPQALNAVVMRAINVDPADRYKNPADFSAALGGRPLRRRTFVRTVPCAGHVDCFQGTGAGVAPVRVCAIATGQGSRHDIESRYTAASASTPGKKSAATSTVTASQLPRGLRAAIRAAG